MVLQEGIALLTTASRGVNKRNRKGWIKANNTEAVAWLPGELEKISMRSPMAKAININRFLTTPVNFNIKYIYNKGVAYPPM